MSFAIIRTGGKQYKINSGDKLYIDKLDVEVGAKINFNDVLFHSDMEDTSNLSIDATVLKQMRTRKIIVFKKERRKNYRRKNGHRQDKTVIMIGNI